MQSRKVYLFIVEGPSDQSAIEGLLKRLFRNRYIYSIVMYGDVTSDDKVEPSRINDYLYEKVKGKLNEEKLRLSDVSHIFQICDMDGAFIPDSSIVKGENQEFLYTTEKIVTRSVNKAIERNKKKREKIDILLNTNALKKIPYKLYYMSSNLDHVLYDIQNLDKDEKMTKADMFFEKYRDRPQLFIEFLKEKSFGVPCSYIDSWSFIKEDNHSLERHNNFFILFDEHPVYAQ